MSTAGYNQETLQRDDKLAKPNYQYEKRQKELAKKRKQEEKRLRKLEQGTGQPQENADQPPPAAETPQGDTPAS